MIHQQFQPRKERQGKLMQEAFMKESTPLIERTARAALAAGMSPNEASRELRKRMILERLREHHGNLCRAASALHEHRNTLTRQMKDLGIASAAKDLRRHLRAQRELQFSRRASSRAAALPAPKAKAA
jgi:Fis family transcriptional regulator